MNDACPICGAVDCPRVYALMAERYAAGRDREHWRKIHDGIVNLPPSAEVIARLRDVKRCQFRAVFPPCGCSGARCGLDGGAIVSHRDCLACVERYPNP